MMTMLIRLCKNSVASGRNLLVTSSHLKKHSPSVLYVMFVCVCVLFRDKNVEWHLSEIYSIFYLYLKVDIMERQANKCCDIPYVFRMIYLWLVWGYSHV